LECGFIHDTVVGDDPSRREGGSQIGELNLGRLNSLRKFYGNLPTILMRALCAAGRPRRPLSPLRSAFSDLTGSVLG
jgi:hypothetical protein